MGAALQLGTLALLKRWCGGHYLCASAAAVELTLLHNFVWHQRYTWRDRDDSAPLARLARFHLSNGLMSMLGNLALMLMLVRSAHLPVLAANGVAILGCSAFNFCLGERWVFAKRPRKRVARLPAAVLSLNLIGRRS
jgi:putative flippase GtrA